MARGKVKWFNNTKGYGFLNLDGDSEDYFVHYSSIHGDGFKSLDEGQAVSYELEQGPKGFFASKVQSVENISTSAMEMV